MNYNDLNAVQKFNMTQTFLMFANRKPEVELTVPQLVRELKKIIQCEDERAYFKFNRAGENFAINRKTRRTLYALYEKALNNEAFIMDMVGA